MALIVQKYGGSSLATPQHIKRVARRVVEEKRRGNQLVVVVSALGDTTDHLVQLARQVSADPPKREMDMLLSVGERTSIALLAMAIHDLGVEAISFTGSQVGIITDNKHTEARILEVRASRLLEELQKGRIVIVAGFQGVSINKEITTLGRGGSDTTAIALAAALRADRCEIMKDVDGVYVADPRVVPEVQPNAELSYDEMIEMAHLGAGVLKTEAVEIARARKVKIFIRSSFTGRVGTIISDRSLESTAISGIVGQKQLAYLQIRFSDQYGYTRLSRRMVDERIRVQSYYAREKEVELVLPEEGVARVRKILQQDFTAGGVIEVKERDGQGLVALVGTGLNFNSEPAARVFETLEKLDLPLQMLQISQLRISWIMPQEQVDETIRRLYAELQPLLTSR